MKKGKVLLIVILLLVLMTTMASFAWSDVLGPGGNKGQKSKRHGVAEPVGVALVVTGIAGLGIYSLKKRKKR